MVKAKSRVVVEGGEVKIEPKLRVVKEFEGGEGKIEGGLSEIENGQGI